MRLADCREREIQILDITVSALLYPWAWHQQRTVLGASAFWFDQRGELLELQVFIEGFPAPEPRHRMGRSRPGQPIRAYRDPHDPGVVWRKRIVSRLREIFTLPGGACVPMRFPQDVPLRLRTTFIFERIQGIPKTAPRGNLLKETKPDLDNLEKCVCDAFTEVGIYLDDSRIAVSSSEKVYAALPFAPGDVTLGPENRPRILFRPGVLVTLSILDENDAISGHRIWAPLLTGLKEQRGGTI